MAEGAGSSNYNKVGATLLGAGLVAIIAIFGPPLLDGGDDGKDGDLLPTVTVVAGGGSGPPVTPVAAAPTARPSGVVGTPPDDLRLNPDDVILTIIAYGSPARVAARTQDSSVSIRERFREQCIPELHYPKPCVVDYVAKTGTILTVTAGDSLAGYWPSFESLQGPGCDLKGPAPKDLDCTITLAGDVEFTATYSGGENPGLFHYVYPTCPQNRGNNPPAWTSRCQ